MSEAELTERLINHPRLKAQIEKMLDMAESRNEILLADDAEDFVIEEGRKLKKIFLEEWAAQQATRAASAFEKKHKAIRKDIKKNSSGTQAWG